MRQRRYAFFLIAAAICCAPLYAARAASGQPDPVPVTRDDVKKALENSKQSTPRLPLPPLTEAEKSYIEEQTAQAAAGEKPRRFGLANNGRMRAYYLADYGFTNDIDRARAGTDRNQDSSFDPNFRTMLFWIVSRGNNCTYCLGHQESGLSSRGMSDDELAALDTDWSKFDEARQAAFAFAVKLSFQPHAIGDEDIAALRKHYDEAQTSQIISAVAGFNATNRWTGPLRIKQDVLFEFVRPTSADFATSFSKVAPAKAPAKAMGFVPPTARPRPALESAEVVQQKLASARGRTARLPLASVADTQAALSETAGDAPQQWMRFLAAGPKSNAERIVSYQKVLEKGSLDPRYKAIIAYVGARNDRAWYALGHAMARLKASGFSEKQISALDEPQKLQSPDRQVVEFARQLTVDPALITDDDFAGMRKLFDDQKVAEIVYVNSQAAFFDRLTEAAGLQLED